MQHIACIVLYFLKESMYANFDDQVHEGRAWGWLGWWGWWVQLIFFILKVPCVSIMSGCCHFGAIFSCCVAQMQIICSWKKTQGICSNSFKIRGKDQLSIDMCLLRSTRCAYYQTGKGSLSNNKTSNNLQSSLPLILFSQRDVGELCRRNSDRIWDPRIPGGRWAVGGGCSGFHQWAVRPMAAMRTQLLLLTLLIGIANGQRRPPQVRLAVFINP